MGIIKLKQNQQQCVMSVIWLFGVILAVANGKSITEEIPESYASKVAWQQIAEIILAVFGLGLNVLSLSLLLSLDEQSVRSFNFYSLNIALNCIDLTFVVTRLAFAPITYHYGRFVGGTHGALCFTTGLINMIVVLWSILIIIGISWVARNDICHPKKTSEKRMFKWIALSGVIAVSVSLFCMFVPQGGVALDASGSYCFIRQYSVTGTPIYYSVGIILIYPFLLNNLYHIYKAVKAAQTILKSHAIKGTAKGKYINMVTKLAYFFIIMNMCYLPTVIASVYEWITRQYVNTTYSAFCSVFAFSNSAVINPFLFLYLNSALQDQLWCYCDFYVALTKWRMNQIKKIMIKNYRRVSVIPIPMIQGVDYNDLKLWLDEAELWKGLCEYCEQEFAMENCKFYEDSKRYRTFGLDIEEKYRLYKDIDQLSSLWTNLEALAGRLFDVYIRIPIAPLEININDATRTEVYKFFFNGTVIADKLKPIHFPELKDLPFEEVLNTIQRYTTAFDGCSRVVLDIIATDLWPRFRKSRAFHAHLKQYLESIKDIKEKESVV